MLSLGAERQGCLRDITVYYCNDKSGGINLVELTFPMLKQLSGLRKLQIILHDELEKRIYLGYPATSLEYANPASIPGIKTLFSLRGITDIKIRDLDLEQGLKSTKSHSNFPDFESETHDTGIVKLTAVLEHFNAALADAQIGKINKTVLDDNRW